MGGRRAQWALRACLILFLCIDAEAASVAAALSPVSLDAMAQQTPVQAGGEEATLPSPSIKANEAGHGARDGKGRRVHGTLRSKSHLRTQARRTFQFLVDRVSKRTLNRVGLLQAPKGFAAVSTGAHVRLYRQVGVSDAHLGRELWPDEPNEIFRETVSMPLNDLVDSAPDEYSIDALAVNEAGTKAFALYTNASEHGSPSHGIKVFAINATGGLTLSSAAGDEVVSKFNGGQTDESWEVQEPRLGFAGFCGNYHSISTFEKLERTFVVAACETEVHVYDAEANVDVGFASKETVLDRGTAASPSTRSSGIAVAPGPKPNFGVRMQHANKNELEVVTAARDGSWIVGGSADLSDDEEEAGRIFMWRLADVIFATDSPVGSGLVYSDRLEITDSGVAAHIGHVKCLCAGGADRLLVSGSTRGEVKIWRLGTAGEANDVEREAVLKGLDHAVVSVWMDADGTVVVASDETGSIVRWSRRGEGSPWSSAERLNVGLPTDWKLTALGTASGIGGRLRLVAGDWGGRAMASAVGPTLSGWVAKVGVETYSEKDDQGRAVSAVVMHDVRVTRGINDDLRPVGVTRKALNMLTAREELYGFREYVVGFGKMIVSFIGPIILGVLLYAYGEKREKKQSGETYAKAYAREGVSSSEGSESNEKGMSSEEDTEEKLKNEKSSSSIPVGLLSSNKLSNIRPSSSLSSIPSGNSKGSSVRVPDPKDATIEDKEKYKSDELRRYKEKNYVPCKYSSLYTSSKSSSERLNFGGRGSPNSFSSSYDDAPCSFDTQIVNAELEEDVMNKWEQIAQEQTREQIKRTGQSLILFSLFRTGYGLFLKIVNGFGEPTGPDDHMEGGDLILNILDMLGGFAMVAQGLSITSYSAPEERHDEGEKLGTLKNSDRSSHSSSNSFESSSGVQGALTKTEKPFPGRERDGKFYYNLRFVNFSLLVWGLILLIGGVGVVL